MRGLNVKRIVSLSLTILLTGCPAVMQDKQVLGGDLGNQVAPSLISNNSAGFSGQVRVPNELISNNSAGLISNNSAGLISNNSAGFRISALTEVPLANSLIYLLNPDEQFFADASGKRIVTTTDALGAYRLANVLPVKHQVLVTAMLSGNRRMVGYSLTQDGDNQVNLSVASTYATEFFRMMATKSKKTMASYPDAMVKLALITEETQKLLDSGKLPIPDLTIGKALAMNQIYLAAFGSHSQRLSDLWAEMIGRRLIALSTVAGNAELGTREEPGVATQLGLGTPTGVAVDKQGNLYIAEQGNHIVRKVSPDGNSVVWGTFKGDGSVSVPELSPTSETPLANLSIPAPKSITCDSDGNVIIVPGDPPGAEHNSVLMFVCQKSDTYFGITMTAGMVYRLGHDDPSDDDENASSSVRLASRFRDGAIAQARFRTPNAVCSDDAGNLYVADRRNNLIRRIDRTTGIVLTIAGKLVTNASGTYGDQLDGSDHVTPAWDGASNGDGFNALGAILNRPFSVAWRRVDADHQELYVWEGTNPGSNDSNVVKAGNAIRRIQITGSNYAGGAISTIVGGGDAGRGFAGDDHLASAAQIRLVDPARSQEVPNGGLAITPDGRYLYFCDTLNFRIRSIDLNAPGGPTITTVAGGGDVEGDSEANFANLKDVSGLAVDATGAVYFCDYIRNVVRKINFQFGR